MLKLGVVPQNSDAWTEPLIVLVKDCGPGREPNLYVNSKLVTWEDCDGLVKQELSRRRECVVYVGGDDMLPWLDVVNVIDVARGERAKVYLIAGTANMSG